jgi:hypothetical protein
MVRCSTVEYLETSRQRADKRWREQRLAAEQGLEGWQSAIPSAQTGSVARLRARVQYLVAPLHGPPALQEALDFYHKKAWRCKLWSAYSRKQSVLEALARRITQGRAPQDVLVGFGSASVGYRSPISRPGKFPTKEFARVLGRHARVEMVDEYLTSSHCSKCVAAGVDPQLSKLRPFRRPTVVNSHPLKVCNHCSTVWNRDINAAKNMLTLLNCLVEGEERPPALRRQAPQRAEGDPIVAGLEATEEHLLAEEEAEVQGVAAGQQQQQQQQQQQAAAQGAAGGAAPQ